MGLTAAAVHELGTPLSTISVITKELVNNNNDEQVKEDLDVIQSQLKICSDILERLRSNNLEDQIEVNASDARIITLKKKMDGKKNLNY